MASHLRCNTRPGVASRACNSSKETHATPKRVSPIEIIRADIDEVFGSGKPIEECLEDLMRHSVRLVLQQVLEDEVTTWLGRDWNVAPNTSSGYKPSNESSSC